MSQRASSYQGLPFGEGVSFPAIAMWIGTSVPIVEQLLRDQYIDAYESKDFVYLEKMRQALLDWCGETDWNAVRYRLMLPD